MKQSCLPVQPLDMILMVRQEKGSRVLAKNDRHYDSLSDDQLAAAVSLADEKAYGELVRRYLKRILAFAYRHLGTQAEAEEVAQETFLRLWTKVDSFDQDKGRLEAWLHRIAYNLSIDILRRRRQVGLDDIPEPDDEKQNPFRDYFDEQVAGQVKTALADLPERQRAALVMSHYQGLSNEETGDILGVSVEAVESLLSRGRRALRKSLASTMGQLTE